MLVLTRKSGESVRIGGQVRVTVLQVAGSQVRVGIEAPDDVLVFRDEVYERIVAANVEAAQGTELPQPSAAGRTDAEENSE